MKHLFSKTFVTIILAFAGLTASVSCSKKPTQTATPTEVKDTVVTEVHDTVSQIVYVPANAIQGDFDGDGKQEFAWYIKENYEDDMENVGDFTIFFSDPKFPKIEIPNVMEGWINNAGDLSENGSDELGFYRQYPHGTGCSYYLFSFIGNRWIEAVEPISIHSYSGMPAVDVDEKELEKEFAAPPFVQKDPNIKGNLIVRDDDFDYDEYKINFKTKSVKIRTQ